MTPIDLSASKVAAAMASSGQPGLETLPPKEARAAFASAMLSLQAPPIQVGTVKDFVADTERGAIRLRRYRPVGVQSETPLPVVVFFHGGGFVLGDLEIFDSQCRRLCHSTNCAVISVDYRLAPEHRFPTAINDAFVTVRWIAEHAEGLAVDATRMAVAGDSAGGNLAAGVCLMARDAGSPFICHQTLIYPATNLALSPKDGAFLTAAMMRHFLAGYLNKDSDRHDWRASPALAHSHAGLPAATVLVAGHDPLHDDGVAYSTVLRAAGVPVELLSYPGQIHGFLLMDAAIPEAIEAMNEIGRRIQKSMVRSEFVARSTRRANEAE